MFCKNCGNQLADGTAFCHKCGTATTDSISSQTQSQYWTQSQPPQRQSYQNGGNALAIIGFIFSFFFAIVGLICSILGYQKAKNGAPYGGLALAGIILSCVWIGLVLLYLF